MDPHCKATTSSYTTHAQRSEQGQAPKVAKSNTGRSVSNNKTERATSTQQDLPPDQNEKNPSLKKRFSKSLSSIKATLTGLPDFNDPAKLRKHIESLEKLNPFSKRLLIGFATHKQRVDIIKHNLSYTYGLIFYDAANPAHKNLNFTALDDTLWHDLLCADSVPCADKQILRNQKDYPVRIVIIPCEPEVTSPDNISARQPCKKKNSQSTTDTASGYNDKYNQDRDTDEPVSEWNNTVDTADVYFTADDTILLLP